VQVLGGAQLIAYYIFIILVAAIFYYLLILNRSFLGGSKLFIFFFVFWILVVCSVFPGIVSFAPPFLALLLTVFLALLGGHTIYRIAASHRMRKKLPFFLLPIGRSDEQLLSPVVTREYGKPGQAFADTVSNAERIAACECSESRQDLREEPEQVLKKVEKNFEELINDAFQAKEMKNINLAIQYFQSALDDAGDISIRGMICTELVFLYKELGKYAEAAKLMEEYRLKNAFFLSPTLSSQFKRLVNYLQKVDELLIEAGCPDLPFSQVPLPIKLKAEQMLRE
jgi:hypothetical protein